MSIPEYKGLTPNQITSLTLYPDSAWHIHSSLAWLDHAKRTDDTASLLYSGIQLRYGIEYLWHEIFAAAKGGSLSITDYKKAVKSTTKLYKLIDSQIPSYEKFVQFAQIIGSLDSVAHPLSVYWDNSKLRRIHGGCGDQLLHFQGHTFVDGLSDEWRESRIEFLHDSTTYIWETMTSRGNLIVYAPEKLKKPEAYDTWKAFESGSISESDVRERLIIMQPIVKNRPHDS